MDQTLFPGRDGAGMKQLSLLWLRDDLRLADNPALTAAAESGPVLPVYVLDESLGGAARWWLHGSLASLSEAFARRGLSLILRRGDPAAILESIAAATEAGSIHWNEATEPDRRISDLASAERLRAGGVEVEIHRCSFLFDPAEVRTRSGEPFSVFTPFWRHCLSLPEPARPLPPPARLDSPPTAVETEVLDSWGLQPQAPNWAAAFPQTWRPGEDGAHERARAFLDSALDAYDRERDRPDREGVSRLSPHLHFGEVTARQLWHATRRREASGARLGGTETFLKEIGWREFSRHLLLARPFLLETPLRPEFDAFPWIEDEAALKAWQTGRTGYPIVDAGIRQLWQSGWMHNRVRMVTASFLVKHLLIHWSRGAAWFWDTLVDADRASNWASWQWVAGCGADAAPFFRIFNPILQGTKFDPLGDYVRRWVPELADLPAEWIHHPWEAPGAILARAGVSLGSTYPAPIVDHAKARARALAAYGSIRKEAS